MRHPSARTLAPASPPVPAARAARCAGVVAATGQLAALLAPAPAHAQTAVTPSDPPAATDSTGTPPDIVKPRTAGPGDSSAGVIHPGPAGDADMTVKAPADKSFPTPVIKPQTMQRDGSPVVPK